MHVNWKAFPIALWWTYWPCFILSVVLDPIQRKFQQALEAIRKEEIA